MFERLRTGRALATTATVLAILLVTLIPSGSGPPLPFSYDLGVGRRWLADGILNLFLFVPLGLTVGWNSRSTWIAVICGLILSTAIEMAQMLVPGRDPALSDIVFNTLGTLGGSATRSSSICLAYSRYEKRSSILASIAVVVVGVVMTATVLLLSPHGPALVTRSGNDLQLQYPTRADAAGLDEPDYWVPDVFRPRENGESARLSLSRERNHWRLTIGSNEQVVGPTIGQGWTLLEYPNAIGRRWGSMLNGLWVFVLCVPIGFWARGRVQFGVAALVIALLLLIPAIAGVEPTSFGEWIGAMMGFLAGTALGWGAQRLGSLSTIRPRG